MEDPETEIRGVITQLCTGSKDEQKQALETYFTNDASFTHPFCSVRRDRTQILRIFQWYKILSPHIDITVHSVAFDRKKNILYVNISQIFRIWFVPFYMADVNLTTVLELARIGEPFKEKYYIRSQNDLYQVDQFVKFFLPWGIGVHIVMLWHWFATLCCVAGATFLGLLHWFVVDTVQRIIRTTPSDERHRVIRDALLDRQDCRFEGDDYDIALQQLLESKRTNAIVEQNT